MKIQKLAGKFWRVMKEESFAAAVGRILHFAGNVEGRQIRQQDIDKAKHSKGIVLFINGYYAEHPVRYRVLHQMEQLQETGAPCAKIYFEDLELKMEENFQFFIFYRCACTPLVERFIELAKKHQKKVCFDIDDLVIDTSYTDRLPFVQKYGPETKKVFDEIVMQTGKTLKLCDMATTTTEALATELAKVVPETYINRNTASKEMVFCAEQAWKRADKSTDRIVLGYFSGSLTHNKDFDIIRPVLVKILEQYQQVELMLVGELEVSDQLNRFADRIRVMKATDWRKLPELIVQADINLAPLEDTLFNRAKSELKWFEAALVRVPTIASKVGAFETMIDGDETGILCENTEAAWESGLRRLIEDENLREAIGWKAYQTVMAECTTVATAEKYKSLIEKLVVKPMEI